MDSDESPTAVTIHDRSVSEDGVSLVDSVSSCGNQRPFTSSEGYFSRCSERLNNDFDAEEFYDADDVEGDVGESEGRGEPEGAEDECNDGKMNVCEVKMERRRRKIIQELLDTEQSYQHHLDHIVTLFEIPTRESGLIPDHVVVTIFSNIRQIISINTELWEHLNMLSTGAAFLQMGPFLKLYSTYANNHERALATLLEWEQKCPEFSQLRRRQEELPELGGLKLNALLITPVQRIPRYKLLLDDLLQNTPSDHADLHALQEATRQIGAVACHINDHIKQQDNFMKMLAIQKSLSGPTVPKLLVPGRNFIKEGTLKKNLVLADEAVKKLQAAPHPDKGKKRKRESYAKSWNLIWANMLYDLKVSKNGGRSYERQFFLFSDILMYAKQRLLDSGAHHSYICCCILPLNHCTASRVFGGHAATQGTEGSLFTITCKDLSLLLYSEQKTVNAWLTALNGAIGAVQESRQTLRKTSSANVPLRRGALVRWTKRQKRNDPLKKAVTARKVPEKPNTRSLRRTTTAETSEYIPSPSSHRKRPWTDSGTPFFDFGCLTPRSQKRRKTHKSGKENTSADTSSRSSTDSAYKPATTATQVSSPDTRFDDTASPEPNSPGDISEVAWATRYPSPIMEESDTSQKEGVSSPDIFNSCSTPAARETERVGSSRTPDVRTPQPALSWEGAVKTAEIFCNSPVKPIPTNPANCTLQ